MKKKNIKNKVENLIICFVFVITMVIALNQGVNNIDKLEITKDGIHILYVSGEGYYLGK